MTKSNESQHRAILRTIARRVMIERGLLPDFPPQALAEATSVYTGAETFPMLPEKLSTDLTSLNYDSDRLAVVVDMEIAADGSLRDSGMYGATVRNRAKLAYTSTARWLEGNGPRPAGIGPVQGPEGTWVRLMRPPVEEKLVSGFQGLDVGHRVRVQLTHTDVERGYIDFKKVG